MALLGHTWRSLLCSSRATTRAGFGHAPTAQYPLALVGPATRAVAHSTSCAASARLPLGDSTEAAATACARRQSAHNKAVGTRSLHRSGHVSQQQATAMCIETERIRPVSAAPAASGAARLRVAVDIDEVLGRFLFALNKYIESDHSLRHQVSDYWVYEFAKGASVHAAAQIWKCDVERSNFIVHEFFKSKHFTDGIPPIPGALQALNRLSETCDLVVVTSRQHVIQDQTLEWIDKHYAGIFQEVYFGNHWSLEGVSRKKSDICKAVGASLLIDDNPTYAVECAAAGIHVLLYDWDHAYPWSKLATGQQHPLIKVVKDWTEVEQQVQQLAPKLVLQAAAEA